MPPKKGIEDSIIRDFDDPRLSEWQRRIRFLCGSSQILEFRDQIGLEDLFWRKNNRTFKYLESLRNKEYPFNPRNRNKYPGNWRRIRKEKIEEVNYRCEECGIMNGQINPLTGRCIVLLVAHLDHDPQNCNNRNLRVMCRSCHMIYDAPLREYYSETKMNNWWQKEGKRTASKLGLWPKLMKSKMNRPF